MNLIEIENLLAQKISKIAASEDPAHDFVIIPKNDPLRKQASQLSAEAAIQFLKQIQYPEIYFEDIAHAVRLGLQDALRQRAC